MEKIPTAKKLSEKVGYGEIEIPNKSTFVETCMIEFAKLHVEAALKNASEKINLTDEVCEALQNHWFKEYIDKDSILNSYPLENIK